MFQHRPVYYFRVLGRIYCNKIKGFLERSWESGDESIIPQFERPSDVGNTVAPCLGSTLFAFFHEADLLLPASKEDGNDNLMFIHLVHAVMSI